MTNTSSTVPNGDPIFIENIVHIPFITTNTGMFALRRRISNKLHLVVSFIKVI